MKKLFIELLSAPMRLAILIWGSNGILQVAFHYYYDYYSPLLTFDMWVFLIAIVVGCIQLTSSGSINFLRTVATNSRHFWVLRFLIILCVFAFNTVIFALKSISYEEGFWRGFGISLAFTFWFFVSFFIFCFGIPDKGTQQRGMKVVPKPKIVVLWLLSFYVWLGLFAIICHYSVLGSFVFMTTSLWSAFVFLDIHVKELVYPKVKKKVWSIGAAFVTILAVASVFLFSHKFTEHSDFLGVLGPKKQAWVYSGIHESKTITELVRFYEQADRPLTVVEAIEVINRITELCSVQVTDTPLVIVCSDQDSRSAKSFLNQNWSADDVLMLLKSDLYYAKLIGIVSVRKISRPYSQEIQSKVNQFAKESGPLSVVALTSLRDDSATQEGKVEIRIDSKP